MSVDIATLGVRIEGPDTAPTQRSLDVVQQAMKRVELGARTMAQQIASRDPFQRADMMAQQYAQRLMDVEQRLKSAAATMAADIQRLDPFQRTIMKSGALQESFRATGQAAARHAVEIAHATAESGTHIRREALQLEGLVIAMGSVARGGEGIAAGLGAASRSLSYLTLSQPEVFALVTTVGLLAAAWESVHKAMEETGDEAERFNGINRVRLSARLAENVANLAAEQRRGTNILGVVPPGWLGGPRTAEIRSLVAENAALTTAIVRLDVEAGHEARTRPRPSKAGGLEQGGGLMGMFETPHDLKFGQFILTEIKPPLQVLQETLRSTGEAFKHAKTEGIQFGQALATGFGAAIDAASTGGHVFQSFANQVLQALSREAKGKAVFEAAEGFAALGKGLLFGDSKSFASAAAHFKAAALYGGAAIASGALAGGGSGTQSRPTTATGTVGGSNAPVNIIQIVTSDGRQISQHVVQTSARQQRLGAVVRVPVEGIILGGPVARTA